MIAILFSALLLITPPVPGATTSRVTQANIHRTVCVRGWVTKHLRPPYTYSHALKLKLYIAGHFTGGLAAYQLDHRVPLEVGGAPRSRKNLWLEPIADAHAKDMLENQAHADLCAGRITLAQARQRFLQAGPGRS